MITAIDTNVLVDLLEADQKFSALSLRAVEEAAAAGPLVMSDMAYAELCFHFVEQARCDEFLSDNGIAVEPLDRSALFLASRIWKKYRQSGGRRTRILTDFLIGAHAVTQANQLLSRDRGFYRKLFPGLRLLDPSRQRM